MSVANATALAMLRMGRSYDEAASVTGLSLADVMMAWSQRENAMVAGIKRACPFCGEAHHLHISEGGIPRPIVVGNDTVRGAGGYEEMEEVDGVFCEVCCASAPLDAWNREMDPAILAVLRDFDPPAGEIAA